MNFTGFFQNIGRQALTLLGLVSYLEVAFLPPVAEHGADGWLIRTRLADAFTQDIVRLVDNSSEVAIRYDISVYFSDGTKRQSVFLRSVTYRGMTGEYGLSTENGERSVRTIGEAEIAMTDISLRVPETTAEFVVIKAFLEVPEAEDPDLVAGLWAGRTPGTTCTLMSARTPAGDTDQAIQGGSR